MRNILPSLALALTVMAPLRSQELMVWGTGLASKTFTLEELKTLPPERWEVMETSGAVVYRGASLREILLRAGVPNRLRDVSLSLVVVARASDGYQVVFTLAELDPEFGDERVLVVWERNGQALAGDQGPLRIFSVKDMAGARSVRMLASLEVVSLKKDATLNRE